MHNRRRHFLSPPQIVDNYVFWNGSSRAKPSNWNHAGGIHFHRSVKVRFLGAFALVRGNRTFFLRIWNLWRSHEFQQSGDFVDTLSTLYVSI